MDKPKRVRKPKMGKLPSEASEPLEEKTDEPVAESEPQDTPEIQRMRGVGLQSLLELAPTTKQRKKLRMG
jgi:hypothetical protein